MKNTWLLILGVLLTSCYEDIHLDLNESTPRVVIEGRISDQPKEHYVRLTRSTGFYETGKSPAILDAVVTISDDAGNEINFLPYAGGNPDSLGYYLPEVGFAGVQGRIYSLHVHHQNKVYTASDFFPEIVEIDSVTQDISESQVEDPEKPGYVHELKLYVREPRDQVNFYLFNFYRNDSLILQSETDVYYTDDELLNGEVNGYPSPVYYRSGDRATMEMVSISRKAYVFYNDLNTLLNNDPGGMFGPLPAAPRTNVTGDALGFFLVAGSSARTLIIP